MDEQPVNHSAWLETADGKRIPMLSTCTLGRSTSNNVVLDDVKVSRRHALIHLQGDHEYWVVDFGSANGTSLNGRRLIQPTRLQDLDQIEIGGVRFRFRQPKRDQTLGDPASLATIHEIQSVVCWLLVADIVSSTRLSQAHAQHEWTMMVGQWFLACRRIIEDHGGVINKFLGDGFFAYWRDVPEANRKVLGVLQQLRATQRSATPGFRIALHRGPVSFGGLTSEECLLGRDVNYAFRMEKLAGSLGADCLLSEEAHAALPIETKGKPVGSHALSGFDGAFQFFSLDFPERR